MYTEGFSLDDIMGIVSEEFPTKFLDSLRPGIKEAKEWYDIKMRDRRLSDDIDNTIPFNYHGQVQNLFKNTAREHGLESHRVDQWSIYHFARVETKTCRIIIRNHGCDFDTEMVDRYSISTNASLFDDRCFFEGKIPLLVVYNAKEANKINIGLYLNDRSTGQLIEVNSRVSSSKQGYRGIIESAKVTSTKFEIQPKIQIVPKKTDAINE
jgi:hypothetical protein